MNDRELLQTYARHRSAEAFQELVRRHARLVYGSARQRVGDAHAAEDITQSVFLALAIKAHTLPANTILTGWLYRVTRFTAIDYLRREQHRREREMTAHETQQINSRPDSDAEAFWREISPHVTAALDELSETDRSAVLLRYYQQNSYEEIAQVLRVSPDSARKRVDRAVDRLRRFLTGKGIRVSTDGLVAALGVGTAEVVPAAVIQHAAQGALSATSNLMLAKGALLTMSLTKLKGMIAVAAACLFAGGTALVVYHNQRSENQYPSTVIPVRPAVSDKSTPSSSHSAQLPVVVEHPVFGPTTTAIEPAPTAPVPTDAIGLLPADPSPPVIRNDYLSQQTAQLFWNSVVEGRLDQAMAVVDTPFAWGIEPVAGRDDLRKRLESPEFKAAFAVMRGKQMEIVLVPDDELSKVLQQKFNLTDTNRIAVVAWVMDGKAKILVAVRAGDQFKVVGIGD